LNHSFLTLIPGRVSWLYFACDGATAAWFYFFAHDFCVAFQSGLTVHAEHRTGIIDLFALWPGPMVLWRIR
jgi:hypothetical protein